MADPRVVQEIIKYLSDRQRMPAVKNGWLPDGESGRFEYNTVMGNELPPQGQVTLNYRLPSREKEKTLSHELAHAADRQLGEQYFAIPPGQRSADQFADAYQKLSLNGKNGRSSRNLVAGALAGQDWAKGKIDYRSSSNELAAYGVGNMYDPEVADNKAPPHVDATMATEMAILLELAQRKKSAKK